MSRAQSKKAMVIFGYFSALAIELKAIALKNGYSIYGVTRESSLDKHGIRDQNIIAIAYEYSDISKLKYYLDYISKTHEEVVIIYGVSQWSSGILGNYDNLQVQQTLNLGLSFPLLLLDHIAKIEITNIQIIFITGVLGDRAVCKGALPYALVSNSAVLLTLAAAQELPAHINMSVVSLGLFDKGQSYTQEARKNGVVIHDVSDVADVVFLLANTKNPLLKSCIIDTSISLFNYERIISDNI